MAERVLVPHGGEQQQQTELYIQNDESMDSGMNGESGNGHENPLVQFPNDRVGSTEDVPNRRFFVRAPQFHWHVVQTPAIDDGARRAIECIAHDAFKFGTQTEAHQELLLLRVQDAEAKLQHLGAELNQKKVLLQKRKTNWRCKRGKRRLT